MICKDNFTSRKKKLTEILNAHGIGYQTTPEETSFITAFFRQFHQDWAEKTRGMDVVTYIITEVHSHCKNGRCFFYKLENGFCCDIGFGSLTAKLIIALYRYHASVCIGTIHSAVNGTKIQSC